MVITVAMCGVCTTSIYFLFLAVYFDRLRLPYIHTTFRTSVHSTGMVTVIIFMWRGRDTVWRTGDVTADLLSMGRKTSSFIDHCKKFRKAFWIILSLKCSWKTLLTRHLNGFFKNRTVFEKFQLKEFYCLCVVHCTFPTNWRLSITEWTKVRAEKYPLEERNGRSSKVCLW